ncbi:MAG TPA: DegV family protein [Epulopiscium sp.]|nr:DegV family protein [Candidatus Epulonipiscium sp.]
MAIILLTDSTCDLPLSYIRDNNIDFLGLTVLMNDKEVLDDLGETLTYEDFYGYLRTGETTSTSQVNTHSFTESFLKHVKNGDSIIYIGLSSALSGTYNSASIAKEEVLEKYPAANISIINTLSVSSGLGLLVHYASEMRKQGKSKEDIVNWIENNKLKVSHLFTVDDLEHLKRGGRLSGASAFVGSLLNIKPLLFVNDAGELLPYEKARGRKKAIRNLVDMLQKHIQSPEDQTIFISHGDCLEEAKQLEALIRETVPLKDVIISMVGTTVGSHSGPGTLALFFLSDIRKP